MSNLAKLKNISTDILIISKTLKYSYRGYGVLPNFPFIHLQTSHFTLFMNYYSYNLTTKGLALDGNKFPGNLYIFLNYQGIFITTKFIYTMHYERPCKKHHFRGPECKI